MTSAASKSTRDLVEYTQAPVVQWSAPDGGWGWICVFGCALMHFLVVGYNRSYGLIYLQLRSRFDSSAALTAWVGGAAFAIRFGCSPLSNALSRRFSARSVVFFGGLLFGTGCVLNAFATSTEYMIFSYTIMAGLGGSLVYTPSLVVVTEYFDKKRSIALGLAATGASVGAFFVPQLMVFLFEHYGFSGGLLILGAAMYNCCVSGALYRPARRPKPTTVVPLYPARGEESPTDEEQTEKLKSPVRNPALSGRTSPVSRQGGAADKFVHVNVLTCKTSSRLRRAATNINLLLDVAIWKDWRFSLLAVSQGLCAMSIVPVWMLLPAVAEDRGLSKETAAFSLSAIAAGDIAGRFLSGFVFDLPQVRQQRYVLFSAFIMIMALVTLLLPFVVSFLTMVISSVAHGFSAGIVVAQRTVILRDLLGVERFSTALGMMVFAQGVGAFIGPFLAGMFRDVFGSYKMAFIFLALSGAFAAVLAYATNVMAAREQTMCRSRGHPSPSDMSFL